MPDSRHVAAVAAVAIAAAAAGLPVVPLLGPTEGEDKIRGKAPRVDGWQTAPLSPETIGAVLRQHPGSNLGMVCGRLSGLVVVDVDPRNGGGEWYAENHGRLMEAGAIVAQTGGGGVHLFFAHPGGWIQSRTGKSGIAPGVELKADGGQQVVIAPSIHKSGNAYEWNPAGLDLATVAALAVPLPAWIATPTAGPVATRNRAIAEAYTDAPADVAAARSRLLAMPPAVEGQGGDGATFAAACVGRDLSISPEIFLPIFQECFAARCLPPWTETEAATKVRNAYRYAKAPVAGGASVVAEFAAPVVREAVIDQPPVEIPTSWDAGFPRSREGQGPILPLPFVLAALFRDRDLTAICPDSPRGLAGIVGRNDLSGEPHWTRPTPWGAPAGPLDEAGIIRCGEWMGAVLGIHAPKSLVWDAAESAAPDFAFHPVRDWLTGLAWDGTPRLASWLADYFGAEPSPLHSAMGRAWTISAVARAFRPGCKADYLLVIEGPQGRKKSTGLAALVGADWFSDDFDASLLGDKDAVAKLRSKWVVEMPEAVAVRRSDVDALKGYLSRTTDRVRLPYQRRAADFPRQSVFCSTTNQTQYLADATGARRFWCVRGLVRYPEVRRDEIAAAREQLWAEAVAAFKAGEPWYLPAEIESGAAESAAARYVADSWEPRIAHWLTVAKPTAPTVLDVWHALAPSSKGDVVALDPARAARIRAVMVRLGWEVSGAGFRLDF